MRLRTPALLLACATLLAATPAHALRVATWNLLNYSNAVSARQADLRTVMALMKPDVIITQEMNLVTAKDSLLLNVLGNTEPGQWTGQWVDVTGEGMGIFWKPSVCDVVNIGSFTDGGPRKVMQVTVKPVGYGTTAGWFRLYSIHLKASAADTATRRLECTNIRNTLNGISPIATQNFLIGGDSNFYGATEGGYIRLTESQSDNDGRCKDKLVMPGTWNSNSGYALYDTQCPCNGAPPAGCLTDRGVTFSGGGLDDRFDWLMTSYQVQDGQGLDLVGYTTFGQDGAHFNNNIDGNGVNYAVPLAVATALRGISDHIPVIANLRLPAKVSTASSLAFGSVITGATAEQSLAVANAAPVPYGYANYTAAPVALPGDTLTYTMGAPAGFGAPGGSLTELVGAVATNRTISMDTGTPGAKSGTLTISSNDPDTASKAVLLSGTVLRHAVASLDSVSVVRAGSLDFGEHTKAEFTDQVVKVYDQAWDALQARLSVSNAVITGGNGRFSIAGGFSPALVGGTPAPFAVHFDTTGAWLDSTYDATLTFTSGDEALPGAQPQPDLVVALHAHLVNPDADVPGGLPTALRFYPPRPNPAMGAVRFAFDLPKAAPVRLEIFDLSGRRLTSLASGELDAGHHELTWSPRGAGAAPGLYFARFGTPGLSRVARLVIAR